MEMMDVTVKVPTDRVGEFYSMFGAWLSGSTATASASEEVSAATGNDAYEAWVAADVDLATSVWAKFSPTAKSLFSTLIDSPDRRFSGDELSEMLGIPNGKHGVAGVLAWPGRHCFAAGRKLLWSWAYPYEGAPAVYWLTQDIADLFRQARERHGS
jgi:hypothetical protein